MTIENPSDAALSTERVIAASPAAIFAAFARPETLAAWWGPDGFTNTFDLFEFRNDGRWVYTMHGPNGANYQNESVFRVIEPDRRIVIDHVVAPRFTLTITLTPQAERTHLSWVQEFENAETAAKIRAFIGDANEQNLNRLEAVLKH
ncbi:MAG: SRPBCC domain-containing protein [Pirellulales bacterium]